MNSVVGAPDIASESEAAQTGAPATSRPGTVRLVLSGTAAGSLAALAFATVHALWIADIWFSLVPMMIAGAICGATIAWSYGRVFEPSIRTWLAYNAGYLIMLAALGLVSVVIFEPRTTMALLLALGGPPADLIVDALPLTIGFTIGSAVILSVLFGRTLAAFGAILVTSSVLVVLLGLDVSVIGLIGIPASQLHVVIELGGLILVLAGSFAAIVVALAWGGLGARSRVPAGSEPVTMEEGLRLDGP